MRLRYNFLAPCIFVDILLISCVTYSVYKHDKIASQNNGLRTPEKYLHYLSLAGGWPGAFIAQEIWRHKTIKQPFRTIFWFTVFVNILATYIIYSLFF